MVAKSEVVGMKLMGNVRMEDGGDLEEERGRDRDDTKRLDKRRWDQSFRGT